MPDHIHVLEEAIKVLSPPQAWCQAEFQATDQKNKEVRAHCAIGGVQAVTRVYWWFPSKWDATRFFLDTDKIRDGYKRAEETAIRYLADESIQRLKKAQKKGDYCGDAEDLEHMTEEDLVIEYNDNYILGSQKSVLSMFRAALKKAKADAGV